MSDRPLEAALRDLLGEIVREQLAPVVEAVRRMEAALASTPDEAPEYLSTADAASLAGVQPATIGDWARRGDLPVHRAGRLLRVKPADLEAFLARRRNGHPVAERAAARVQALLREGGVQLDRRKGQ